MSLLRPESRALLATVKGPSAPLFSNMVMAEEFDRQATRGPLRVLPRTDGRFVLFDSRQHSTECLGVYKTLSEALFAMESHR